MNSHIAINNFIEANDITRDIFGHCTFEGMIEYTSKACRVNSTSTVRILRNGYNDGEINIHENETLNIENYHLDFNTDYQDYIYSIETNELKVFGNSKKMKGEYVVSIRFLKNL
ncbi:hypothetical protein KUV56_11180 [Ferrimonas balearica]|uniref:hypothetical protein n=1 Tax=Ferrimonas balearica TaxID=44012 RepID=UPI001C55F3CC|nr:hypothetical protein [Ferrimonas balearica]MBW3140071.1 hypothetical protein [Ferrimonas balearica]